MILIVLCSLLKNNKSDLREKAEDKIVAYSVNYLESHDDLTLGDFIRIGLGDVNENQRIEDLDHNVKLTAEQMNLNKLAALFLFTCQ